MTAAHILILAAFILLGGAGLAAIQESLALCLRTASTGRKRASGERKNTGLARHTMPAR